MLFLNFTLVILFLVLLVASSNVFLRGAIDLAHTYKLPDIIVGGIIIAVGTSAPEIAINVFASLRSEGDIVISNIVGSNIVNIALGLGLVLFLGHRLLLRKPYVVFGAAGLYGAIVVLIAVLSFQDDAGNSHLSRWFGVFLLLNFVFFFSMYFRVEDESDERAARSVGNPAISGAFVVGGAMAMALAADQVVAYAVAVAVDLNVPSAIIGATIVAAGGSLPEVASCVAAARAGRPTLVVGNVVGSQLFNIFGILGLSAVVRPIEMSSSIALDLAVLFYFTVIVFLALVVRISPRLVGVVCIASYFGYMSLLLYVK